MTGVAALLSGSASPSDGAVSLSDQSAVSQAEASYSLLASGDFLASGLPGGVWIAPRVGMPNFEARVTVVSGSLAGPAPGDWLSLATSRTWSVFRISPGEATAEFTVEIRRAGGSTLASAAIILTATF